MPLGQNSSLKIGQIIYVLSNKAQKIIPAIVVEEMTVKKLDGNEVSWKVSVGPTGKEKIIDSKRLDGELYASLDEVQNILKERLEQFINTIVEDAAKRADAWYGSKSKIVEQSQNEDKVDPDSLVEEDIASATPKITEIKKKSPVISKAQAAKEARNKLIAAMSEEPQKVPGDIVDQEEIKLPDGQVVKVNIRT
jgi:hypothetical protein